MEWIYLVIALVVLIAGLAVVVVPRLRGGSTSVPPARPSTPAARPPRPVAPSAPPSFDEAEVVVPDDLAGLDDLAGDLDLVEPEVEAVPEPEQIVKPRLRDRLTRVRANFAGAFGAVRGRAGITDDTWDDLEEALITADVGVGLTGELLGDLRAAVKADKITDPEVLLDRMKAQMLDRLGDADRSLHLRPEGDEPAGPSIWLFVGVNGVGKTTTIGKLAAQQRAEGRSVLLAAGDTFRAAAAEQLGMWADRAGAELVRGDEGADPAAIIFDGVERAAARGHDLVMADTAGRLHTKVNLMEELRKVRRVAEKGAGRISEVLLVIDATTGQNGMVQAREFTEAVDVTGVVLTKLDGSAKGGIVLAIQHELGIPVKLVGVGEALGDLTAFDPAEFVDALFSA